MTLTPAQIRTLRKAREGRLRPSRGLLVEGALIRKGLLTPGSFRPTDKGLAVELPPYHYVLIHGIEREVELRDDGVYIWGESAFPLSQARLAQELGVDPQQVAWADGGVLITGGVTVHER